RKQALYGVLLLVMPFISFVPVCRAADNPATTVQAEFAAARASLAAGDSATAQDHYVEAIVLGLRQLAQLELSAGHTDQATAYLDDALRLKPTDVETQVDTAGVSFRKGEVPKAEDLLKSIVAANPTAHPRAHGLLGRIYLFEGDFDNATLQLRASLDL